MKRFLNKESILSFKKASTRVSFHRFHEKQNCSSNCRGYKQAYLNKQQFDEFFKKITANFISSICKDIQSKNIFSPN